MELLTANELSDLQLEQREWLDIQMLAFIRGDEDENVVELFYLPPELAISS